MSDVILVLNAGSSSIKFSLFLAQTGELEFLLGGQLEGLYTAPRFTAKDAAGAALVRASGQGHAPWSRRRNRSPDRVSARVSRQLPPDRHRPSRRSRRPQIFGTDARRRGRGGQSRNVDSARPAATSRTTWRRSASWPNARRSCRRSPASILLFIMASRSSRRRLRCRPRSRSAACAATVSTACPMNTSHPRCRRWMQKRRQARGRGPPWQWRQHVRAQGRQERGEHDGLYGRRRPADGHALRFARSVCGALPDGRVEDGRARDRKADLPAVGAARRVGRVERHGGALLASTEPRAKLAVDLFIYRIGRELGSLAAAAGGLDAVVFTGGIGERAAVIRERVCRDAGWLGIELDAAANQKDGPRISTAAAACPHGWCRPTRN